MKWQWSTVLGFARHGNPVPPRRDERSPKEWQAILTTEQFHITREHGTERAHTGEYCEIRQAGIYGCRCCGTTLFDSTQKFESGTGWPSFTEPVEENVIKYLEDRSYGMHRVEVQCNVCDAHLGHVFPDGPAPTGLRYCINSASILLQEKT